MHGSGRFVTIQRYEAIEELALNTAEVYVVGSPVESPEMATLMLWNSTTEEDKDQQCPQSHPFAFDKVEIFRF